MSGAIFSIMSRCSFKLVSKLAPCYLASSQGLQSAASLMSGSTSSKIFAASAFTFVSVGNRSFRLSVSASYMPSSSSCLPSMGLRSFSIVSVLVSKCRRKSEFLMTTAATMPAISVPKTESRAIVRAPEARIGVASSHKYSEKIRGGAVSTLPTEISLVPQKRI